MNSRPNIILIMTDQMRQDSLSCMGNPGCGTPCLDSLAGNGTLYTQCITTSPICAPARASMLLGLYPSEFGVLDNSPHIVPIDKPNWVRKLRDSGYNTSVFGKTHYYAYNGSYPDMRQMEGYLSLLGYERANEVPGPRVAGRIMSHLTALWEKEGLLEDYCNDMASRYGRNQAIVRSSILPFELYPDVYPARMACRYIEEYDSSAPMFMFLSFPGPHDPWDCPREYRERYPECSIAESLGPMHDVSPNRPKGIFDEKCEYDIPSSEEIAQIRMDYSAHVRLIDDMISTVVECLKRKGRFDETVIIFTSDHGEMLGDFGRLYKGNFMHSSVSVPLLISGHGLQSGIDDRLCTIMDIGPTILDVADVSCDCWNDGISILGNERRNIVFSEYRDECMAFDGKWKIAVNGSNEPYMLFNTFADPDETENLAGMHMAEENVLLCEVIRHKEKCNEKT